MADLETTTVKPHPAWSALVGLTTLGVLLQGLWAGLFLRRDADGGSWVWCLPLALLIMGLAVWLPVAARRQ